MRERGERERVGSCGIGMECVPKLLQLIVLLVAKVESVSLCL